MTILGISFDPVDANAAFAKKFNFPFRLLSDTERKVGVAYGACADATASHASRISYLIDGQGKIAVAYPKVSPAEHSAEVLADAAKI
ncbi:MAG: redoxin domain-containing protein [Candidatus Binataceae bacterium]|nr:redoxin domain-containing protein [Candidatus Binataceae bacterium]